MERRFPVKKYFVLSRELQSPEKVEFPTTQYVCHPKETDCGDQVP